MPTVVTDQERVRRVLEENSRRQRDLAAYRRVEEARNRERLEALADDCRAAWERTLEQLRSAVPGPTYEIWIGPLSLAGRDGDTLLLAAHSGIRIWVERRYLSLIRKALQETDSRYTDVRFVEGAEA